MTNAEYQQLVDFMGRRFTEVDARLDEMATKQELREQQAETRRHFEVFAEGLRADIRQVAEGVLNVDEKLGRFRQEVQAEFDEIKAMIKFSYAELDRRVRTLEDAVVALRGRVERLEARQA
jgi:uncharacterized protein involved in exopolysaccharide biosynthesis